MNWGDIGGWVAAAVALIGAVFVYGRLSQEVANHAEGIQNLWSAKTKIDERVAAHGERIAKVEGKVGISQ